MVPSVTGRFFSTKSSSRSSGLPTSGLTMPLAPLGITWADTALVPSVISDTSAVPPVTRLTLPARPPAAITGWFFLIPSSRAGVDLHRRVPDGGRAGDHARGHRAGGLREAGGAVQAQQAAQLRGVALGGGRPAELLAQALDLGLQLLVLVLGVHGVAEPAEQVAEGLERLAGAGLQRRERGLGAALERAERASGLAEGGGEHDHREDDEDRQGRPSPADHFAVEHSVPPLRRRANDAGCFGNSCWRGEWPRTPRGSGLTRLRRT